MQNLKQSAQVYWNIRWLRRLVITSVTFLIILLLIPVGIQQSIAYVLKDQGATEAKVEDINLNLFSGSFELSGLNMQVDNNDSAQIGHIYANINMLDLINSRIVLDEVTLQDVSVQVYHGDDGSISVNGIQLVNGETTATNNKETQSSSKEPLAFAINKLFIKQVAVSYQEPNFQQRLAVKELTLNNIKSWEPDSIAAFEVDMALNESPINLTAQLKLFDKIRKFKGQASIKSLAFAPYAKFYRDYLKHLQGKLTVSSQFDISMSDHISGQIENNVEIAGLDLQYQHIHQQNEFIQWKGKTELIANSQPLIQGSLQIKNSTTTDSEQKYEVASFSALSLQEFLFKANNITLDKINLQNTILATQSKDHQLLDMGQLNINKVDFHLSPQSVTIEQIILKKPMLQVTLDEKKQLQQITPLLATIQAFSKTSKNAETKPATANSTEQDKKSLNIKIAKLTLQEPGRLDFSDLSISPNYKTTIHFNQIEMDNISSTEAANFQLALKQGDYTTLNIKGSGLLLDPTQKIAFKANIKQLDLPPVTAYTSAAMGYGMKSGVVDSDINVNIDKRNIDSLVDLKIDSIEVVETQPKTAEQVTSASGMSIDLAVSTLKDDNNIIDLKLPVKGNLDQPDFDLSLVINKALGKAMQSASLSYLKYALQPFGSLVSLFNLAKAAAEHISLPPIVFQTNSLKFADKQQDLLDKVVKVLKERPELKIKACGVSSLADMKAKREQLITAEIEKREKKKKSSGDKKAEANPEHEFIIADEIINKEMKSLADNRSAKVKSYLIEKGNLKPNKILNCLSSSDTREDSQPVVELQI
jgi:hypothetical protein